MIYRSIITVISVLLVGTLWGQSTHFVDPDSFLIGDRTLPKILLLGTWHFNYPGLDAFKTEEKDKINIFSDQRQQELGELLDYISKFKPTMIAIERYAEETDVIERYRKWQREELNLGASEIDQIAMRLMDRLELDTVYGVDAPPLLIELQKRNNITESKNYTDSILARHYFGGSDPIMKRYIEWYTYQDKMRIEHTLLANFLQINSDKVLDRGFGAYISGGQFNSEQYEGADALSMFWFNRNLRIFRNIQRLPYDSEDRVLVLFGAGHMSILKYLFECSPQFELIKLHELEKLP